MAHGGEVYAVVAAVVWDPNQQKILLVQERGRLHEGKLVDAGRWNLVAGRLQKGESVIERLEGEMVEEAGYHLGSVLGILGIGTVHRFDMQPDVQYSPTTLVVQVGSEADPALLDLGILDRRWFSVPEILGLNPEEMRGNHTHFSIERFQAWRAGTFKLGSVDLLYHLVTPI